MRVSRRLLLLSTVLAAGCVSLSQAPPVQADDPRQILIYSLEPRVSGGFYGDQETVTTPVNGKPHREAVHVFRKGSILRIEYPNGQVLFDDGVTELLYLPRQKVVERGGTKLDVKAVRGQRRILESNRVAVQQLPDDMVAGRAAYVVSVTDTMSKTPPRKIWIDKETYLQLRLDVSHPLRLVSTYFTGITFQAPPAEKLAFTPPADAIVDDDSVLRRPIQPNRAEEIARSWSGRPVVPGYLPPGFIFRGFYLHRFNNQDVLVSVYADGMPGPGHKLSIFQVPSTMGMPTAGSRTNQKVHAVNANKGKVDVTLISPLPDPLLQRVMGSIPPQ